MDGNKGDALKCLKIGKEALEAGDRIRALKFATKASRLDPTLPVSDLLSAIQNDLGEQSPPDSFGPANGSSGASSSKPSDHPTIRPRVSSTKSSTSSSSATYTGEQIEIVRKIKKKKDYYEILGLEKSCTVEDVRKAYRKLSLKVHPDKNTAPGAEEAFKAVSKAFQCLSNEDNRKTYDLVGTDEPSYERRPTRHGANGFNGFYDADFDADEIFRNFFYSGMAPAATTQFRTFNFGPGMRVRTGDQGSSGIVRMLIQFLPILVILLVYFLPSSEPKYSLSRSYPYEYQYTTEKGVNFYVKSRTFEEDYPADSLNRVALERQIEREYFSVLAQNCHLEMQRQQWGFISETPHCDMLREFQSAAY